MGLLSALNSSVSGLNVNQQQLDTLSQNIANANTPNYSSEVANQQAAFISGLPEGVTIASITRQVNDFLTAEVRTQTSTNGSASTVQNYYNQVENLLGQPGGTSSIDQSVSSFFTALQDMANAPSISAQTTVLNAAQSLSSQISGLAGQLENMRLQADQDIVSSVGSANSDLQTLQNLNTAIERANATGSNTSGLLDQRDATLANLAQYLDINPSFAQDGEVSISTTSGVSLLTSSNIAQLAYNGAPSVSTFTTNTALGALTATTLDSNGNPIGRPVNLVTAGVSGSTITTTLTGGKIAGDVTARDSVLPSILSQLDTLAAGLRDQVNTISNSGTSFPPPNSYTGTRLVSGTNTSQWSGSVRIAVLNPDGTAVTSPYADEPNGLQPLTLNLATLNTGAGAGTDSIDGIIHAINQYYGPPQDKVEFGSLNNVQLGMVSNTIPDTGTGGTLSFDFNLNNISANSANFTVTGIKVLDSTNTDIADTGLVGGVSTLPGTTSVASGATVRTGASGGTITANLSGSASPYFTVEATIQTVDSSGNTITSTVDYHVTNNATNVMNNLIGGSSVKSGPATLVAPTSTAPIATATLVDANGNPLPTTNGLYGNQQGYLKITASNGATIAIDELDSSQLGFPGLTPSVAGSDEGFSQYFGLNNFFANNSLTATGDAVPGSAINLAVASSVVANPSLISTGRLAQNTNASGSPDFTYGIASGDNTVSQELAGLATQSVSFGAAGGMPAGSTTFGQYAGQIISVTSANATTATNTASDAQTLLNGFTKQAQSISGVNLDQQLANTVIYQNSYTASARVITVIGQMFTDLLSIIQ